MTRLALALCLLIAGCAISVGITNSPPPPGSCTGRPPGTPPCS